MTTPPFPLRDAHLHLAEYGESLTQTPLGGCRSVEDVLAALSVAADRTPSGRWVRAAGMRIEALKERRAPTAREIDGATGGRLVIARSFDHHAMAVSSKVLASAGIDRGTPDPAGGIIVRDDRGEPTGLLLEHACDAVWKALPAPDDEEYRGWVDAALEDLSRRGFVEVHDMMARARLVGVLRELERAGRLSMRVRVYAVPEHFDAVREACGADASRPHGTGERVRFGGIKMFADGTLNSRTAHMLHAYAEPLTASPRGTALLTREEVAAGFCRARAVGAGAAVHAIGDAAVRSVLDAVESLGEGGPKGPVPREDVIRVEHAQFIDRVDVDRFPALGVVCSVQPCHLLTDVEAVHRLAPGRAERAFPLADLVGSYGRSGLDPRRWVWLGSDAPVVPPVPEDNVQAAVHRCRAGADPQAVAPGQAISESMVWDLMRSRG